MGHSPVEPDWDCSQKQYHGNPFRYCAECDWREEPSHIQRAATARKGMLFEAWATFTLVQIDHKLNQILGQNLGIANKENKIMAAVQIEQDDLDAVATSLEALVTAVGEIDTTVLAPADESKLNAALADVTSAINAKLPVSTPVTDPDAPADGS